MRSLFLSKIQKRAQTQKRKDKSLGSEYDYADQDRSIGSNRSFSPSPEKYDLSRQLTRIEQQNQTMLEKYNEVKSQNEIIIAQNLEILNQNAEIQRHIISVLQHQQTTTSTGSVKPPPVLQPSRNPQNQRSRLPSTSLSETIGNAFVSHPSALQSQNAVANPTYNNQPKPSLTSCINVKATPKPTTKKGGDTLEH